MRVLGDMKKEEGFCCSFSAGLLGPTREDGESVDGQRLVVVAEYRETDQRVMSKRGTVSLVGRDGDCHER